MVSLGVCKMVMSGVRLLRVAAVDDGTDCILQIPAIGICIQFMYSGIYHSLFGLNGAHARHCRSWCYKSSLKARHPC